MGGTPESIVDGREVRLFVIPLPWRPHGAALRQHPRESLLLPMEAPPGDSLYPPLRARAPPRPWAAAAAALRCACASDEQAPSLPSCASDDSIVAPPAKVVVGASRNPGEIVLV